MTEQASLEAELKGQEARLQALNENLRIIMWSLGPDLRFTCLLGSGLKSLGLEENELVGITFFDYFSTRDPGYLPIAAQLRALEGEAVHYAFEWRGRRYRCFVEPHVGPSGEVLGTIGAAIDVTEQLFLEIEPQVLGRQISSQRVASENGWRPGDGDELINVGHLSIDVEGFEVWKLGQQIDLTPTEFRLLVELARHSGKVLTRDALLRRVWGDDFFGSGSLITMAIKRLRDKIEVDPGHPSIIETVRGVGYRLRTSPRPHKEE